MRKFIMTLDGAINGSTFTLNGDGLCSQATGRVQGDYALSGGHQGAIPIRDFSHHAFSALIITGYPSESVSVDGISNPFAKVNHHYERTLSIDGRGKLTLTADIKFCGSEKNIESAFHVDGDLLLPELASIDTVVETWVPISDHAIEGTFVMPWVTSDGERIAGLARTIYHLDEGVAALGGAAHRIIQISSTGSDRAFHRDQSSFLFGNIKGAIASA